MALEDLRLLGGVLGLDFVNSIENRAGHGPEDFLTSYPDLVRWGRHAGLVDDVTATRLIARAAADGPAANEALRQALGLRAALHRLFLAVAARRDPDPTDLEALQHAYADAMAGAALVPQGERFAWDWRPDEQRLDQLLWPVARSAVELLTTGDPRRIKVCANPYGCGWLFYDGSKNGSRRWCSMEGCGSQVKMRRQYARRRASAGI
jgi:predicted RNA-binding Zn ribbon-like protein